MGIGFEQQRCGAKGCLFGKVTEPHPPTRAEGNVIGQGCFDLRIARQAVRANRWQPNDRARFPKYLMVRIRILQECVGKRIEI